MKLFDLSMTISEKMLIFPGDPEVRIRQIRAIEKGDSCNLSLLKLGSHTGTHVDAPAHFVPNKSSVDKIDLNRLAGEAILLNLSHKDERIEPQDLKPLDKIRNKILLISTKNSFKINKKKFLRDFVYITGEAARAIVRNKVKAVGFDFISVEKFGEKTAPVHRILLQNGIPIIEGLNLRGIKAGQYFFICLPLKVKGCDGSPARAILLGKGEIR